MPVHLKFARKHYKIEKIHDKRELQRSNAAEAQLVSSELDRDYVTTHSPSKSAFVRLPPGVPHAPVLDIDFAAQLIPSSTQGHFHLYLDKEMTWKTYKRLLKELGRAGVIEPGYARASIARGASYVRPPGVTKENTPGEALKTSPPKGKTESYAETKARELAEAIMKKAPKLREIFRRMKND